MDLLGPNLELGQHALGKFGDGARAQTLTVFGLKQADVDDGRQLCRADGRPSSEH